jgi:hypothetical protein
LTIKTPHPKAALIERLQKDGKQPTFDTSVTGPQHEPVFRAAVKVAGDVLGEGEGPNKRAAEKNAAEAALAKMDDNGKSGGAKKRRSGRRSSKTTQSEQPTEAATDGGADGVAFEGPWPVFEEVLATCLRIAHERVAPGLASEDARYAIEQHALLMYKRVLQDLGDVVDDEDEAS